MDATTVQPTLLSAARNFMRKSAGKAALVIAPLAVVSLAPQAKGQTTFAFSNALPGTSGTAYVSTNFSSGSRFVYSGATTYNVSQVRFGAQGTFDTTLAGVSGAGTSASNTLIFGLTVTGQDIPASTPLSIAYDFDLTKVSGISGNVNWSLVAEITSDASVNVGSGSLTTGSNTFTGNAILTTIGLVPSDYSRDLQLILYLDYTTATSDSLAVSMNQSSQGFTISAIPEPSTYAAIFGLGALGFVCLVRRHGAKHRIASTSVAV